jgi:hypothetical protein
MRKAMTINTRQAHRRATSQISQESTRQAHRKSTSQIPQESNPRKQVGEVGESYSDSGHKQLESMSHMFSTPPSITYIGREGVNGSVLGLVR